MLSSIPQPDGTTVITSDFPYHLTRAEARLPGRRRSQDEARSAAEQHLDFVQNRFRRDNSRIEHDTENHAYLVISIEPQREPRS